MDQPSTNLKSLFLLDPAVVFLNHGSFGATPRPVFESYQRWQVELERQPVEFLGRRHNECPFYGECVFLPMWKEALDFDMRAGRLDHRCASKRVRIRNLRQCGNGRKQQDE